MPPAMASRVTSAMSRAPSGTELPTQTRSSMVPERTSCHRVPSTLRNLATWTTNGRAGMTDLSGIVLVEEPELIAGGAVDAGGVGRFFVLGERWRGGLQ